MNPHEVILSWIRVTFFWIWIMEALQSLGLGMCLLGGTSVQYSGAKHFRESLSHQWESQPRHVSSYPTCPDLMDMMAFCLLLSDFSPPATHVDGVRCWNMTVEGNLACPRPIKGGCQWPQQHLHGTLGHPGKSVSSVDFLNPGLAKQIPCCFLHITSET